MPELVLYGIRLLTKQLLGIVLDIEVDQSASSSVPDTQLDTNNIPPGGTHWFQ